MSAASIGQRGASSVPASGPQRPERQPHAPADAMGELVELFAAEHTAAVAPEVEALVEEIRRRHGAAVRGVLFYGSCLRRSTTEGGVLDFYVVVDAYRAAYAHGLAGSALALANWLLPPSVYYVETPWQGRTLRMKYNIITQRDFSAACRPQSLHPVIWARFCQPAVLVWARDAAVRQGIATDGAEAALTMVSRMLALAPQITHVEDLWQFGFARTYATEWRPETSDTIGSIYRAATGRYRKVTELAVSELARRGLLQGHVRDGNARTGAGSAGENADGVLEIRMDAAGRRAIERRWAWTASLAKPVYLVRLVKSAFTFGDWLPYAIWKLGRHTGVYIELTDRQRRHPLVWGWPVLFRLLRGRTLR